MQPTKKIMCAFPLASTPAPAVAVVRPNKAPQSIARSFLNTAESTLHELTTLMSDIINGECSQPEKEPETPERTRKFREQKKKLAIVVAQNEAQRLEFVRSQLEEAKAREIARKAPPAAVRDASYWEMSEEEAVAAARDVLASDDEEASPVTPLYLKFITQQKEKVAKARGIRHGRSASMPEFA
jgi:hypothetical protein